MSSGASPIAGRVKAQRRQHLVPLCGQVAQKQGEKQRGLPGMGWAGQGVGQPVGSDGTRMSRKGLERTKSKTAGEGMDETKKGGMGRRKAELREQALG